MYVDPVTRAVLRKRSKCSLTCCGRVYRITKSQWQLCSLQGGRAKGKTISAVSPLSSLRPYLLLDLMTRPQHALSHLAL